jgi:hypothetical protein
MPFGISFTSTLTSTNTAISLATPPEPDDLDLVFLNPQPLPPGPDDLDLAFFKLDAYDLML